MKQKDWFLANTCAGGGKWKTLNKIHKAKHGVFANDRTRKPGWKPLLVELSPAGWVLCDTTSVEGKQLRVVEVRECGSFGNLIHQYGFCLVTDAVHPVSTRSLPIICNSLFSFEAVLQYLDLYTIGKKDGRMDIAVQPPTTEGETKYLMKDNPTWEYKGMNAAGYELYEIYGPVAGNKASVNTRVQNYIATNNLKARYEPGTTYSAMAGNLVNGAAAMTVSVTGLVALASFAVNNREVRKIFAEKTRWVIT